MIPVAASSRRPTSLSLAQEVIVLCQSEHDRRVAAGEDNHVDDERHLLPRWRDFVARGQGDEVLIEAVGYLSSSSVNFQPSNPAYAHETSPNALWADALLCSISRTAAGNLHERAQEAMAVRFTGRPLVSVFMPTASCFQAYCWTPFEDRFLVHKDGGGFVPYALVAQDVGEAYQATYRVPPHRRRAALEDHPSSAPRGASVAEWRLPSARGSGSGVRYLRGRMKILAANLAARPCTALVLNYGIERTFVAAEPLRLAKVIAKDDLYLEGVEGTLTQLTDAEAERLLLARTEVPVACAA